MGVKQLWTLLAPVGRPVLLETMEGKALAIDSSIWIYQFQATMRDKEGRGLTNAHLLGFLRRICKLLFYGIKPVFVFDGGAPALKRSTITERKRRKAGAALSHAKVAERLLAAQLRREAISHVKKRQNQNKPGTADAEVSGTRKRVLNEDTVYMEDIMPSARSSPRKPAQQADSVQPKPPPAPESPKKYEWKDHDPYKLPELDLQAKVAAATRITDDDGITTSVDPRLATEEELRQFIETMRPEDFDANSPAFRELPTEVQYEIIGDLRLKSRQTSYSRLQKMLRSSKTALDFSKAQIQGLHSRNRLTQQLLFTTNSMGKEVDYHLTIPVRIAAERNREYMLIKNNGPDGGWSLSIKDEGTKEKPIRVEQDSDDDDDMEEVPLNEPPLHYGNAFDQRRMALASIGKANYGNSPNKNPLPPPPLRVEAPSKAEPLFTSFQDVDSDHIDEEFEPELDAVIEQSLGEQEERDLQRALQASRVEGRPDFVMQSAGAGPSSSKHAATLYEEDLEGAEEMPTITGYPQFIPESSKPPYSKGLGHTMDIDDERIPDPEEAILSRKGPSYSSRATPSKPDVSEDYTRNAAHITTSAFFEVTPPTSPKVKKELSLPATLTKSVPISATPSPVKPETPQKVLPSPFVESKAPEIVQPALIPLVEDSDSDDFDDDDMEEVDLGLRPVATLKNSVPVAPSRDPPVPVDTPVDDDEPFADWSRSPTPDYGTKGDNMEAEPGEQHEGAGEKDDWDAADEVNVEQEEDAFVDFMSQVKGKDLDAVRDEIEQEINELNKAKKVHQRDSEEITQQMVGQIMMLLRLFGIPYITAPMEAEAQCATLLSLGLVEGVITDDSDVFLFGATRVFKNMFNQSKTVEVFLASDLQRELTLDQEKLISLAYLLGSDYVDGLEGVGPVLAMEIVSEFDQGEGGEEALRRFKEWWIKVQSGKDKDEENDSAFKKKFKKKFKNLHLSGDWLNPAVRDAYVHPTVDESEETFKWGLPDLDALRTYLGEELRWNQTKVDDLLLPIIRKMGQRSRNVTANKQSTLSGYFDATGGFGTGTMAPRQRQPYASKRLQQVVSEYRKSKDQKQTGTGDSTETDSSKAEGAVKPKAKATKKNGQQKRKTGDAAPKPPKKRRKVEESSASESDGGEKAGGPSIPDRPLGVSLRARGKKAAVIEDSEMSED